MGRWSRHPMGSDTALDARDWFMKDFDDKENDKYFFELPKDEIKKGLLKYPLEEMKKRCSERDYLDKNRFVIPYTFVKYKAFTKDKDVRLFLYECLSYHEDFDYYDSATEMAHVNFFKEHFTEIMDGKLELFDDPGLLAVIEKHLKDANRNDGTTNFLKGGKD